MLFIIHQAEFSGRSDIFFYLKTNSESGRQKTKENIIPRGKFRLVENDPNKDATCQAFLCSLLEDDLKELTVKLQ